VLFPLLITLRPGKKEGKEKEKRGGSTSGITRRGGKGGKDEDAQKFLLSTGA